MPKERLMPLDRFARPNAVPRCSGRWTSLIRANQLGESREVSASALSARANAAATHPLMKTLLRTAHATVPDHDSSGTSSPCRGKKNSAT